MTSERIAWTKQGPVALVELGDGTRRNALRKADWEALTRLITSLARSAEVQAIVIAGHQGTFSAGSDMSEWSDAVVDEVDETFVVMERCFQSIEAAPVPVVAAVEGVAAGAGCQLALACDLVVMAGSARIGMPIARLGILASPAFAARVSRRAGATVAADLYLTGRLLTAREAADVGLVSRLAGDDQAAETALGIAGDMALLHPGALAAAKVALGKAAPSGGCGENLPAAPTVAFGHFRAAVHSFLAVRRPA